MNTLRARSRKVLIGAFVAASLMLSTVVGFGADDASARACQFSVGDVYELPCYNSTIRPEDRP